MPRNKKNKNRAAPSQPQQQQASKGGTAAGPGVSVPVAEKVDDVAANILLLPADTNTAVIAESLSTKATQNKNQTAPVALAAAAAAVADTKPEVASAAAATVSTESPKKITEKDSESQPKNNSDDDDVTVVGLSKSQKKKNKNKNKNKGNKTADVEAPTGEVKKSEPIVVPEKVNEIVAPEKVIEKVTEKVVEKVVPAKTESKIEEKVITVEEIIKPEELKGDEEFTGLGEFQTQQSKSKKKNKNKNKQDTQVKDNTPVVVNEPEKIDETLKTDLIPSAVKQAEVATETKKTVDEIKSTNDVKPVEKDKSIIATTKPTTDDQKSTIEPKSVREDIPKTKPTPEKSDAKKPSKQNDEVSPNSAQSSPAKLEKSEVTQPKTPRPACPVLSPDIASIWKILDPPNEPASQIIVEETTEKAAKTSTRPDLKLNIAQTPLSEISLTKVSASHPDTPKILSDIDKEIKPIEVKSKVTKPAEKSVEIEKGHSVKDTFENLAPKKTESNIKDSESKTLPAVPTSPKTEEVIIAPVELKSAPISVPPESLPKPVKEQPITPTEKPKPTGPLKQTAQDSVLLKVELKNAATIDAPQTAEIISIPKKESEQQQQKKKKDTSTAPIKKAQSTDKDFEQKKSEHDTSNPTPVPIKVEPKTTEPNTKTQLKPELAAIPTKPSQPEPAIETLTSPATPAETKPQAATNIAVPITAADPQKTATAAKADFAASASPKTTITAPSTTKQPPEIVTAKQEKPIKTKTAAKEPKIKAADKAKDSTAAAEKSTKSKATKTKSKAPAPPEFSKDAIASIALTEASTKASAESTSAPQQELPVTTAATTETLPVTTDSKNAAGSDSVQSVDVAAHIIGSKPAESLLHAIDNKPQDVNVSADVILSNDVNATFTITAKKGATAAATAATSVTSKDQPKNKQLPESSKPSVDAAALLELLQNKPSNEIVPGIKPGAVAGNVRTKTSPPAAATAAATAAAPKNPTGTVPKQNTIDNKHPTKQASPAKETTPQTKTTGAAAVPKAKQPSPPPKEPAATAAPANKKSSARKTPPRNAAGVAQSPSATAASGPTANTKSTRVSPHKEKPTAKAAAVTAATANKPTIPARPNKTLAASSAVTAAAGASVDKMLTRSASSASSASSSSKSPSPNPPYDDEEYVEFKFSPRPVYMSTICQVCKVPLPRHVHCKQCLMVSYCSVEHQQEDADGHRALCAAIQEIAKKRGGHVYNNARILNDDDYRSLRVHTLNLCENALQRHLQPFEREILLFPRLCATGTCREWRQQLLAECKSCGQVSFCADLDNHMPAGHARWCQAFSLYQKLVFTQKKYGRIEPSLPSKIMTKPYQLPATMDETFKSLYKNYGAIKDDCTYAALTQLATAPLTAYYGLQRSTTDGTVTPSIGERFNIHLVGAELQFEADTLDKWETFFLHLVPQLVELRITFVGPELNAENLPLEILSRIRMCRTCRQSCRAVKFDFQCGQLYHSYANSSAFAKPDLICFFNPGLYRATGFNGVDTWPETIRAAAAQRVPIIVTSYTEVESPRDLDRLQREATSTTTSTPELSLVLAPHVNPFSSQRPERNFISDEVAPMIFKNYYCFVCK